MAATDLSYCSKIKIKIPKIRKIFDFNEIFSDHSLINEFYNVSVNLTKTLQIFSDHLTLNPAMFGGLFNCLGYMIISVYNEKTKAWRCEWNKEKIFKLGIVGRKYYPKCEYQILKKSFLKYFERAFNAMIFSDRNVCYHFSRRNVFLRMCVCVIPSLSVVVK